jgi:hypothetical protein
MNVCTVCYEKRKINKKNGSMPPNLKKKIFGTAGLKFHVCRKELAVRRRGFSLVVQDQNSMLG